MTALGDALLAHHKFIDEFRQQGAGWSFLRSLNLQEFGELDEPGNLLKSKILDAIEAGHVPVSAEPKWKMPTDLARLATR